MLFSKKNTPRWMVFLTDVAICLFSLALAWLLRFNFDIPEVEWDYFPIAFGTLLLIRAGGFYFAKTYAGIIRYTNTRDAKRIFLVVTGTSLLLALLNFARFFLFDGKYIIPFSVLVIDYLITCFTMISIRIAIKIFYLETKNQGGEKLKVLIFGAGEAGVIAKRTIDRDTRSSYKVLGFIDDDKRKAGTKIEGVSVFHANKLEQLLSENRIAQVVLSIQNLSPERKKEVIETCLLHNTKVLDVPPVRSWINGELSFKQIKTVQVDDLLGRAPIVLSTNKIKKEITGKTVLVTGAAGSIGSELVRQIVKYHPKKTILLDQAESALYDLEMELKEFLPAENYEIVIGDICLQKRMENLFNTYQPKLVFHAAAYKHVPMMENNPAEAVRTNVLGSKNIVDLSIKFGVEKMVLISTDKAVNPTNVMGASKRVAEIYAQSNNSENGTKFITTRFGNVLGSNGSVISVFKKQIDKGGPITVTHKDVTRYFMTIPEACELVLEAGTMGKGGEIFVFDMGKSVKIFELAKKMVKLSGLQLGKDIEIKVTGLRPGEKLYEELLADSENTLPTHHKKIMIGKTRTYNKVDVTKEIEELLALYNGQKNEEIVRSLKKIVPEYKSENSTFEKLDK